MNLDPINVFAPPIMAVVFALLGWISDRTITRGGPLTPHMRRVLSYAFLFVLGVGYLILWQDELASLIHWRSAWIFLIIAWGGLLFSIAWWRYTQQQAVPKSPRKPVRVVLVEGIAVVGLMICVIGSLIEWESIFKRQGRWWVGVLWIAGVAVSVIATRQGRRATVLAVLRGVVALLAIGAIAERTSLALIAALVSGLVLLLFEKLWRANPKNRTDEPGFE